MMTDDDPDSPPTAAEQVQMLFVRHEGAIRAFVRALQPSLPDADDELQETFLIVSRKASSFEPGTHFVAWACGMATGLACNVLQAPAAALGAAVFGPRSAITSSALASWWRRNSPECSDSDHPTKHP